MGNTQTRARRTHRRSRRARAERSALMGLIVFLCIVLVALGGLIFWLTQGEALNSGVVVSRVTLEAGQPITLEPFLREPTEGASFVTDVSGIDTSSLGTYEITLWVGDAAYSSQLVIQDTVPPTAEPVERTVPAGASLEASELVTNLQDATPVTVTFAQAPDLTKAGDTAAVLSLTDAGGNTTTLSVTVHVTLDTEAPVITGAADLAAYVGDTIRYKANITVTDDQDPNPTLEVDTSQVRLSTAGVYPVVYTARDSAGNTTTVEVSLTLTDKPETYVEPDVVYALAQDVLADILAEGGSDMDDMDVAYAIYRWCKRNIGYVGTSDKTSWTRGAYDAFTTRSGDCFNYYAAARALLDVAGIPNLEIVKSDTSHSSHFWNLINLGTGWYHFDTTPRVGTGDNFFMVTDAELEAYSSQHSNSHIFDPTLYPERATESVQDLVDYGSSHLNR